MAITQDQKTALLGVTSFMFDYAPDQESFARFESIIDGNPSFYALGRSLEKTDAFNSQFSDDAVLADKIDVILGRLGLESGSDGYEKGVEFINARVDDGVDFGQVLIEIGEKMLADEQLPELAAASATLKNKIAVAEHYLESGIEGYSNENLPALLDGIDDTQGSVDQAKANIDNAVPGVEGETFSLTAGADSFTGDNAGTENDDTFDASIGQNVLGQIVNTLSSADKIDGGAGNDTLNASLSQEAGIGGENLNVQPTTESVETVNIEARSSDAGFFGVDTVTLDAKNMVGVNTFGSEFSDGDLVIQNVNTLDNNGNFRNTSDMTVRMDHTDNFNSDGDASDLTVYFDDDYLLAGQQTQSNLQLRIVNTFELAENDSPLEDFQSVDFTVGEQVVSVDISGSATYQDVVNAINSELNDMGLQGVEASLAEARTALFTDDVAGYEQGELAGEYLPVDIVSTNGDLAPGTIERASDVADFDGLNTWVEGGTETTNDPISVNVELEKVGRAGEGGNLVIGGKSQQVVDGQENGIQVFDIDVLGNEKQPSNLGSIKSTNNTLQTINIATGAEFAGADSVAGLTIRGADENNNASNPFGDNVNTINAAEFEGDLTIGTKGAAQNVDTLIATGGGDVEFNANITGQSDYVYTTGAGDDTINVALDSDAIDATGTGLKISTGGGNDTVTLNGENGGASQLSMAQLENVVVGTGGGDDRVNVESDVNAIISTGGGSDFVNINAEGALNNGSFEGQWTFGRESASTTGANVFADQVLYNAELTVTFAGFESTVDVETDAEGNFVATQENINAAIIDAIESDADLSRLLTTDENGLNELNVRSLVNGENNLSIDIDQPVVVDQGATAGQVNLNSGDRLSVIEGLLETGVAGVTSNDDDATTAGNIAAGTTNYEASNNGGSSDAAGVADVNFSTVNLGAGSDDLVVFDSNDASANVLEIDAAFGHANVVNFHDEAPTQVTNVSEVGNHGIDFTAFLDNQTDASSNSNNLSAQDIAISLNTNAQLTGSAGSTGTALANSVNMLNFDETQANSIDFADLSASDLVAALNGTAASGVVTGGLSNASLNAVTNTTNLVGSVQDHIVMIENDQNEGEYKVFHLTSTVDANTNTTGGDFDTSAVELGTLDFGQSINFQLVGSAEWEDNVKQLMADADGVEEEPGNGGDEGGNEGGDPQATAVPFDVMAAEDTKENPGAYEEAPFVGGVYTVESLDVDDYRDEANGVEFTLTNTGETGVGTFSSITNFTAGDSFAFADDLAEESVDVNLDDASNELTVSIMGENDSPVWTMVFEGMDDTVIEAADNADGTLDGQVDDGQAAIDAIGQLGGYADWLVF